MTFLISYDIPATKAGDRRRSRLARALEGLGLRVQYSLFEIEMPPESLPVTTSRLEEIIDPKEDSLRVYPLCGSCRDRIQNLGVDAVIEHGPLLIW